MSVKKTEILLTILSTTFVLQGCTQPVETNVAKNTATNQSTQSSNTNSVDNTFRNTETNRNIVITNNSVLTANTKPAAQSTEPTAKTTAGANDLAMFMVIRSKFSADQDLINNVIVEIKQGNVTLTGNVSGEAQKKKSEDIVKSVEGIRSVKNNLKIGQ